MDGDQFALVTGGGAGIGKATALALARAGWHVAVTGRRREKLDEVAREIGLLGRRAIAHACDVGDPEAVKGLFADDRTRLRPARPPVQQRRARRARRAARRTDLRAVEGGGRRQPQRRIPLRARRLRPDEAAEAAGRADHQQRLDLGPRARGRSRRPTRRPSTPSPASPNPSPSTGARTTSPAARSTSATR